MENYERPRLTVDLEPAQKQRLKELFPWGTQRSIIIEVLDMTIRFFERYGRGNAFDAIITGRAKIVIEEVDEQVSISPDIVDNLRDLRRPMKSNCPICGLRQFDTPSGVSCPKGHGGAEDGDA